MRPKNAANQSPKHAAKPSPAAASVSTASAPMKKEFKERKK